jgi:hypothetical protein
MKYLEKLGLSSEDQKAVYFIDPYFHTTKELIEAMARDYGLDSHFLNTVFVNPFSDTDRVPGQLPVAMQKAPTREMLSRLNLPEEVVKIMQEALDVNPQTLGDWRIEVDKISAKKLFVALGLDPDLIKIVSFEEILSNRPDQNNLTIANLATNVKEAHETYAGTIAKYSGRNGDAVVQNLPSMLRIVGRNNEKVLFLANGEVNVIKNGQRLKYADVAQGLSPQELLAEYETIAIEVNLDKDRITILENRIKSIVVEDARRKLETELKQKIDDEFSKDVEDIRLIRLLLSARQSIDGIKNAFNLTSIEDFITSGALLEAITMIKDAIKTGELNWNRLLQISNNGIKEGGVIKPFAKNQLQSLNALQAYVEYVKNKPHDVEKNSTELNGTNDFCSIIDTNIIERLSTMVLINIDNQDELNPKKILAELALVEKEISQRKQKKQAKLLGIDIDIIDPKKIRDCILGRMQSLASNNLNDEYGQDIIQEWNKKNIAVWGEEILKQLIQEKKVQGMCSEKQMLHKSNIESILKISYPDMWNKMVSTIYQNAMPFN